MPFALVGCVQKKNPPAKVNDASCVLKKPPKRGGYPKKQDANRFSRMRPKTPPAKVNDACVLKKPPKRGGYQKKNSMPIALVGCVQKKNHLSDACVLKKPPKRGGYPKKQDVNRFSRMRQKNPTC